MRATVRECTVPTPDGQTRAQVSRAKSKSGVTASEARAEARRRVARCTASTRESVLVPLDQRPGRRLVVSVYAYVSVCVSGRAHKESTYVLGMCLCAWACMYVRTTSRAAHVSKCFRVVKRVRMRIRGKQMAKILLEAEPLSTPARQGRAPSFLVFATPAVSREVSSVNPCQSVGAEPRPRPACGRSDAAGLEHSRDRRSNQMDLHGEENRAGDRRQTG